MLKFQINRVQLSTWLDSWLGIDVASLLMWPVIFLFILSIEHGLLKKKQKKQKSGLLWDCSTPVVYDFVQKNGWVCMISYKKMQFWKKKIPEPSSNNFFYFFGQHHVYSNHSLRSSVRQMPKKVSIRIYIPPLFIFCLSIAELSKSYKVKLSYLYQNHLNTFFI